MAEHETVFWKGDTIFSVLEMSIDERWDAVALQARLQQCVHRWNTLRMLGGQGAARAKYYFDHSGDLQAIIADQRRYDAQRSYAAALASASRSHAAPSTPAATSLGPAGVPPPTTAYTIPTVPDDPDAHPSYTILTRGGDSSQHPATTVLTADDDGSVPAPPDPLSAPWPPGWSAPDPNADVAPPSPGSPWPAPNGQPAPAQPPPGPSSSSAPFHSLPPNAPSPYGPQPGYQPPPPAQPTPPAYQPPPPAPQPRYQPPPPAPPAYQPPQSPTGGTQLNPPPGAPAPQPPNNLRCAPLPNNVVQLQWQPSLTPGALHLVLRSLNGPPTANDPGQQLAVTADSVFVDRHPPIGVLLSYAVFAVLNNSGSANAARAEILMTADVDPLECRVGDSALTLRYGLPEHAQDVVIRRSQNAAPRHLNDGEQVAVTHYEEHLDRPLRNGTRYYYTLFCRFPGAGKVDVSAGRSISGIPLPAPHRVGDLKITPHPDRDDQVILTWTPPDRGEVWLLRTTFQPDPRQWQQAGQAIPQLPSDELERLTPATLINARNGPPVIDTLQTPDDYWYTPFTVFDGTAYMGTVKHYRHLPDIRRLQARRFGHRAHLTWTWPANCDVAWVQIDQDHYATAGRPAGRTIKVSRDAYEQRPDRRFDLDIPMDWNQIYIVVAASVDFKGQQCTTPGQKASFVQRYQITYRFIRHGNRVSLRLQHPYNQPIAVPPLIIGVLTGQRPLLRAQGQQHRLAGMTIAPPWQEIQLNFLVPPNSFGRVFLEDARQCETHEMLLDHPDHARLS